MRENMEREFGSSDSVIQDDDSNKDVISNPDVEKVIKKRTEKEKAVIG